jgi:hypothetical protein
MSRSNVLPPKVEQITSIVLRFDKKKTKQKRIPYQ